jgi:hypothetical protein
MTIQYKNAGINLSTTDTTSVLTAPSNAVLLVLEASDILKFTAGTADEIQGIISYAQLDRSQQNG